MRTDNLTSRETTSPALGSAVSALRRSWSLLGERLQESRPLGRDDLERTGGLLERHADDLVAPQRRHLPPVRSRDEVGGLVAHPDAQDPVEEGRGPAPLHVTDDGVARLDAGLGLEELGELLPHAAVA